MKAKLMGLFKDETGQAMTEYGLILALIAVVVIGALALMGPQISAIFTNVSAKLAPAAP
jgi:pilus assembly protein Flp/PilA